MVTKNIKQCIEFYYLWKKIMAPSTKKKWRTLKRSRVVDYSIEQNLRSCNKEDMIEDGDDDEDCVSNKGKKFVSFEGLNDNKHPDSTNLSCIKCNLVNSFIYAYF
jgi:hypothetical protein